MHSLEELFCSVDDFCQIFEPRWEHQLLGHNLQRRKRRRILCLSEIMTIMIGFHQSCYRNFKTYYERKSTKRLAGLFSQICDITVF
jgi:hypothetical protein